MAQPYQVPDANYGWSARDACYAFGAFDLQPDEALVITHSPPPCRFWNFHVWNPFMATYNHHYERVSVNIGTAERNRDGTVTIVIAQQPVGHPNAISTLGHGRGVLAFRWFHAEHVPEQPETKVVSVSEAPAVLA